MSMPSNGQHSFLLSKPFLILWPVRCVNALQRATLISTEKISIAHNGSSRVNALQRATLISTGWELVGGVSVSSVSMPSNGPHSFLHSIYDFMDEDELCQCPQTGHTHFYSSLTAFIFRSRACQCPQTGHTHFYDMHGREIINIRRCQCPPTGHTHFYQLMTLRWSA